jgi:hypothetical protein
VTSVRKSAGSTTSRSARSASWHTARTRAIALSGCDGFWICRKVALATTWAPVRIAPPAITTPEPVDDDGERVCHGLS